MVQVRVREGHQSLVRTYSGVSFYRDTWREIKDKRLIERLKEFDVLEFRGKSKEIIETVADTVKDTVNEIVNDVTEKIVGEEKEGEEIWTEEKLNKLEFRELKAVGATFNTTDRSKTQLIKEILKIQADIIKEEEKLDKALEPVEGDEDIEEIPRKEQGERKELKPGEEIK